MLGTLVNTLAILLGGGIGLVVKKGLQERYKTIVNQGVGLCVIFVGASTCLANMFEPDANPVLFIVSIAIGGLLGEWINIEKRLEGVGDWLQKWVGKGQGSVSAGFVSASLLFCVGTMAVLGPLESGLKGEHSILFAKSIIDGIIALIMASTLGVGVLFSAISVLAYQGLITMLAVWVSPYITADMLRELSIVGGILIAAIGLNMLGVTKIRVGNLLPAIFVPIAYYCILMLV